MYKVFISGPAGRPGELAISFCSSQIHKVIVSIAVVFIIIVRLKVRLIVRLYMYKVTVIIIVSVHLRCI